MKKPLLVLVALAGLAIVAMAMLGYRIATFSETVTEGRYEAGIVLGARVVDGQPSPAFAARIDHAIDLYNAGIVEHVVFTGGNPPPKDPVDSEVARAYAVARGMPVEDTFVEHQSRSTLENLREAKAIVDAQGWRSVLVISDPYHLYRAARMARSLDMPVTTSAAPNTVYRSRWSKARFLLRELYLHIHFTIFRQ